MCFFIVISWDFPGGAGDKESACRCRRHTDAGPVRGSGRSLRGGHGNPLQCSCLGNPIDRGAWWAIVHRVTKSWTRLNDNNCPLPYTKSSQSLNLGCSCSLGDVHPLHCSVPHPAALVQGQAAVISHLWSQKSALLPFSSHHQLSHCSQRDFSKEHILPCTLQLKPLGGPLAFGVIPEHLSLT